MASFPRAVRKRVDAFRYGFFFLPVTIVAALGLLAVGIVELDRRDGSNGLGLGFRAEADAARVALSTIAGSLITVAGLTFSITIVTLQLVSQQFTPRALRTFLGDRLNQFVAGSFVGIFLYCLLVLRTVRNETDSYGGFVPAAAVTVAFALAVVALILLLVFIHHIASSIQVSSITGRIVAATLGTLDRLYPAPFGAPVPARGDELVRSWRAAEAPDEVRMGRPGYIRSIALDELPGLAERGGLRIHVAVSPGDFVTPADPVAYVWPAGEGDALEARMRRAFVVADDRDIVQDPAYGLRQLTDIALRALSPGVNDPTTAVTCVGYVRAVLEQLAGRELPADVRELPEHDAVIVVRRRTFDEFVEASLVEIGRHADGEPRVLGAVLDALAQVGEAAARAGAGERLPLLAAAGRAVARPALELPTWSAVRVVAEARLGRLLERTAAAAA